MIWWCCHADELKCKGSEGLFAAIEDRGNVYSGFAGAAAPGSGALGDLMKSLKT